MGSVERDMRVFTTYVREFFNIYAPLIGILG
jgi:hypothetical protein